MAKIDYSKSEASIGQAICKMRVDKLAQGKPVVSKRACDYFNIDIATARSVPEDMVAQRLEEETLLIEKEPQQQTPVENTTKNSSFEAIEYEDIEHVVAEIPYQERIVKARPRKKAAHFAHFAFLEDTSTIENHDPISPLVILRNHILWLKIQGKEDRYEILGTTQQEIFALRKKTMLDEKDIARIADLNIKAIEIKKAILLSQGCDCDEKLVQEQQKNHKNKYLTVRDRWLKL